MATVTKEILESLIERVEYQRHEDTTLTHCVIHLKNGWVQDGSSACIDPNNFDVDIGRKIAYENAFDKLWQLEGYLATVIGWEEYEKLRNRLK